MHGERDYVKCAALCSGYMLDVDGATGVADMQKTFRFANPCAGKSVDDVRSDVPLLIARAGQDQFTRPERVDRQLRGGSTATQPAAHAGQPCGCVRMPSICFTTATRLARSFGRYSRSCSSIS